ncbi:diaminobutyrate--2-oxoglutarate transaminase [Streptomyces sp. NPDC056503]|uniref:diaminobutyrate--2-oxoglutarate transaminase n=1 Tax=Streptomyces sp. NPDC056503 TaxID=3345842 RepID=UPI0036B6B3B3
MTTIPPTATIEENESAVRTYSRSFPSVFASAKNEALYTADGTRYLDFLSGAGSLNYGHNPEPIKQALVDYLQQDGLMHGLDLATSAKAEFLSVFRELVLEPRGLAYRVQFTSPSGTNAVEAALKLARLVTGRTNVVAFSGGFHGVSTGSLSATGSGYYRQGLEATLPQTTHIPYPESPLGSFDSLGLLRAHLEDPSSGVELPAAVLLETVQGEGGVYVAPVPFLRELRELCDRYGILLIVDDIQAGCGRTGTFFSFERAGIVPDLVTLSKSIGGYGLPMAITLIKPELDIWRPGQHNGTFRGNQLAFVAAAAAIRHFWSDGAFAEQVVKKGALVEECLQRRLAAPYGAKVRGLGLMYGVDLGSVAGLEASKVSRLCFERGLIVETCGRDGEVLKLLPPLTVSQVVLSQGLDIIINAVTELAADAGYGSPTS